MKKPFCVLIITITALCNISGEVDLSDKDKSIIHTKALEVLRNYESTVNSIGEFVVSDIGQAKSEAEGFLELFVNRQVLIYNDLDPSHQLSEFYEAETYSSNMILWYPDGLSIIMDFDNAKVSEVIDHGENVFSLDIFVNKKINGNYLNQTLNSNNESLSFRIAFRANNRSFSNFRIVGIRDASSNLVINYNQALREVNAEEFGQNDLLKIHDELKATLRDYSNYLALLGDPQETDEDKKFYRTSFTGLFDSTATRIFNDINPQPVNSLITVVDYLNSYETDYPEGINNVSMNSDSAYIGNIIITEENSYYTYVDAEKFFSGRFGGKDIFRNALKLKFKITFNKTGKTFSDFKIEGIDVSSVDFYEGSGNEAPIPENILQPVTRRGIFVSFYGSFGQTSIIDRDIIGLTLSDDLHSWNPIPDYGYIGGIDLSFFVSNNLAIKTGIEYSKYSSGFNIEGTYQDDEFSTDVNSDSFYKIIQADFDSVLYIDFLTIPVHLRFVSGKPRKFGIYADAGINISFPVSKSYHTSGDYKFSGYYPYNPEVLQYLEIEELGFYNRTDIDIKGEALINTINIALYASAGVNIPLGYYSSFTIGPEIVFGVSDIAGYKDVYSDIFGKTSDHLAAKIKSYGIKISFTYKLR